MKVMVTIFLVICIAHLFLTSLLVHGVRKEKPCLIRPWIVLTFISLLFYLIQIIVFFFRPPTSYDIYGIFGIKMTTKHKNGIKDNDLSISFYVSIGFALICVAIGCYPLSVVSSFRMQLQKKIRDQVERV